MKAVPIFRAAHLPLDRHSTEPAYRQIYQRFRDAITCGILRPGDRIPSVRNLASQLVTARGTIDLAYSLLSSEGYVTSRGAAGTYVATALAGSIKPSLKLSLKASATAHSERLVPPRSAPVSTQAFLPFQMGLPALDAFPHKLWSRLAVRSARKLSMRSLESSGPSGYTPLRRALTSYLAVSRGILCSPQQVIITSGFQGALGLITHAFLQPHDAVWFEEPGYFHARLCFEDAGANLVPVPVDDQGLDVAAGIARAPRARFAYVTPSHQAPLGVALTLPRRLALLAWAAKTKAWIIEDDYDSEFRYGSRPLPSLKGLDDTGRVLYVGSFSKVLLPGLRLGYLVVPDAQIDAVTRIQRLTQRGCQLFEQTLVEEFMTAGHFSRHIKRMRTIYAERRAALAAALTQVFGDELHFQLQAGGMHLLARFTHGNNDRVLAARAAAADLAPTALSLWRIERSRNRLTRGLLLSFTNIPPEAALGLAQRLKHALDR
jgi:GntR family transcriptional regulator/MocR family aminotransferase